MKILTYILTSLLLLLGSCTDSGLTDNDNVIKEDISGKPIYEGMLNDDLEFSLIPLVEGNSWTYNATTVEYAFDLQNGLVLQPPSTEQFKLKCTGNFIEGEYRWFEMEVDKQVSLEFPHHNYNNNLQSLSNRKDGMLQKVASGEDAFGNTAVETKLLLPYYENNTGSSRLYNSDELILVAEKNHQYTSTDGTIFTDLIRYRYQVDLSKEFEEMFPFEVEIFFYYDYYFSPELGLVAFSFENDSLNDILNQLPDASGEVDFFKIRSLTIELVDYKLIDI